MANKLILKRVFYNRKAPLPAAGSIGLLLVLWSFVSLFLIDWSAVSVIAKYGHVVTVFNLFIGFALLWFGYVHRGTWRL